VSARTAGRGARRICHGTHKQGFQLNPVGPHDVEERDDNTMGMNVRYVVTPFLLGAFSGAPTREGRNESYDRRRGALG